MPITITTAQAWDRHSRPHVNIAQQETGCCGLAAAHACYGKGDTLTYYEIDNLVRSIH